VPGFVATSSESERRWEVVTIEGQAFPAPFRVAVSRLTLWHFRAATLEPVPFQIDEPDQSGQLAAPNGPQPSQDESPGG
jgi:hypothetical protein